MQKLLLTASLTALLAGLSVPASANDELMKMEQGSNWAMQAGDYANQRHSKLKQITTENVGKLEPAWTFSTGVLRGHEGSPLVIGDMMYVHAPFPNIVYALDLNNDGKILWKYEPKQDPSVIPVMCCDTVNRGVAYGDGKIFLHQADTYARGARRQDRQGSLEGGRRRSQEGRDRHLALRSSSRTRCIVGVSGAEFGVRCRMTAYDINNGKLIWRAYSMGPDNEILVDPDKTMSLGKPVGKDTSLKTWNGDQWKIGGGSTWGWMSYDPKLNLFYYGTGNPSTWNPAQRAGPTASRSTRSGR